MRKVISVGVFSMNLSALFQFSSSLDTIFSQVPAMAEKGVYLRDYRDFLNLPSTYTGTRPLPASDGLSIDFDDVTFTYPGQEKPALKNLRVHICPGEKISIVGPNGAGKTTFVKLLLGMMKPTSGHIQLNGVDAEELDAQEYRKLFCAVMQDFQMYSFTLRENITFSETATETQLERADRCLRDIGMRQTVERLPHGIETYLTQRYSEDGVELSGGENQKLAIARALYRDAPVMILDEPTASLSPQSENEIYRHFGKLTSGRTALMISHRLSGCTLCDRILVFDEGELVQNGHHRQLMEQGGLYAEMFQKQTALYGL